MDCERLGLRWISIHPVHHTCRSGLVALHNGKIWATSEGLGRGATFHVELPVITISSMDSAENKRLFGADRTSHTVVSELVQVGGARDLTRTAVKHVLVVDDAMLNRKMVVRMLSNMGCRCTEKADGKEALNAVLRTLAMESEEGEVDEGGKFDLILMDYEMPGDSQRSSSSIATPTYVFTGLTIFWISHARPGGYVEHSSRRMSYNYCWSHRECVAKRLGLFHEPWSRCSAPKASLRVETYGCIATAELLKYRGPTALSE